MPISWAAMSSVFMAETWRPRRRSTGLTTTRLTTR